MRITGLLLNACKTKGGSEGLSGGKSLVLRQGWNANLFPCSVRLAAKAIVCVTSSKESTSSTRVLPVLDADLPSLSRASQPWPHSSDLPRVTCYAARILCLWEFLDVVEVGIL